MVASTASRRPASALSRWRLGPRPQTRWALGRLALAVLCASAACKRESPTVPPEPSARPTIARGELVVLEQTAAVFQQTRVLEVADTRLRVDSLDGGDSFWIARADVYTLGRTFRPAVGSLVICQHRNEWLPCKVEQASGDRLQARDGRGRKLDLGPGQVLEPRPVTALNLRRHFERAAERDAFLAGYAAAGKPPKPSAWLPAPRARVLAARDGEWYSAQIHEFDEEVPRVSFALDGRVTELPVSELAPEPPYDTSGLKRGDFVLRRPPGPAEPWQPVQIRSLGDQELRVADVSGELFTIPLRDVVPLSAGR